MKTIQINLEDKEYADILVKKGNLSWRDFLLHARIDSGDVDRMDYQKGIEK